MYQLQKEGKPKLDFSAGFFLPDGLVENIIGYMQTSGIQFGLMESLQMPISQRRRFVRYCDLYNEAVKKANQG